MGADWEGQFTVWAKPPGKTESDKCENAISVVRNAVSGSGALKPRNTRVFAHGSYKNRTNVRVESDVDVCGLCSDTFIFDLPDGTSPSDFGIDTPATYGYAEYKNHVQAALIDYLGAGAVKRGNKAFDLHENSYRVDADVVACFSHRRYRTDGTYLTGTAFYTDAGVKIINWPDQNYNNGVAKNKATGQRFKSMVRIWKQVRDRMVSGGVSEARGIPSYLIECILWNTPNSCFGHGTYTEDVRAGVIHLYNATKNSETCKKWVEINGLLYLFHSSQPWSREQVNALTAAIWRYLGLE